MYKFMQNYKYNECIILIFLFANFLQIYNRSSITKKINKMQFFCINIQLLYLFLQHFYVDLQLCLWYNHHRREKGKP